LSPGEPPKIVAHPKHWLGGGQHIVEKRRRERVVGVKRTDVNQAIESVEIILLIGVNGPRSDVLVPGDEIRRHGGVRFTEPAVLAAPIEQEQGSSI
jgi:hypothetical protein